MNPNRVIDTPAPPSYYQNNYPSDREELRTSLDDEPRSPQPDQSSRRNRNSFLYSIPIIGGLIRQSMRSDGRRYYNRGYTNRYYFNGYLGNPLWGGYYGHGHDHHYPHHHHGFHMTPFGHGHHGHHWGQHGWGHHGHHGGHHYGFGHHGGHHGW